MRNIHSADKTQRNSQKQHSRSEFRCKFSDLLDLLGFSSEFRNHNQSRHQTAKRRHNKAGLFHLTCIHGTDDLHRSRKQKERCSHADEQSCDLRDIQKLLSGILKPAPSGGSERCELIQCDCESSQNTAENRQSTDRVPQLSGIHLTQNNDGTSKNCNGDGDALNGIGFDLGLVRLQRSRQSIQNTLCGSDNSGHVVERFTDSLERSCKRLKHIKGFPSSRETANRESDRKNRTPVDILEEVSNITSNIANDVKDAINQRINAVDQALNNVLADLEHHRRR